MIELQLLGTLTVSSPELSPIAPTRRRGPLALLALIASAAPEGVTREEAIALLWPDSNPERANKSLDQTLFWLRQDLDEDLLLPGSESGLRFDPTKLTVDLWAFRDALDRGAPADAVEAYGGPFLADFLIPGLSDFSRWVDAERETVERQYSEALDTLARASDTERRQEEAVEALPDRESPAPVKDGPNETSAHRGRRPTTLGRWLLGAAAVAAIAIVLNRSRILHGAGHQAPASSAPTNVVVLGSGMKSRAGRDVSNRLVSCRGAACPTGSLPQNAYVVAMNGGYAPPVAGTRFIAPVQNGTTTAAPGYPCCTTATFENDFTLPPDAVSATISISVLADNRATVAINDMEFGRQPDSTATANFAGPRQTFTTTFGPEPSGRNRLSVTLWDGGGSVGLEYNAVVTYVVAGDTAKAERPR